MAGAATEERWIQLCCRLGRSDPGAMWTILGALYGHPPRAYHNLGHIGACLVLLDEHRSLAADPDLLEAGLWLHDCVYDPRRSDNEARSAAIGAVFVHELGLGEKLEAQLKSLIMATTHRALTLAGDEALIADIDMAILGAAPDEYDRYAAAIRQEYSFVADMDFRRGRGAFLRTLSKRDRLYHTPVFETVCRGPALQNIARELRRLGEEST